MGGYVDKSRPVGPNPFRFFRPPDGLSLEAFQCGTAGRRLFTAGSVALDVALGVLVELGAVVLVLVGDAGLEGVVGQGFDEELAHGLEDALDAAGGLPVLGLEDAEADVAGVVVGDVGVPDARVEDDRRRLEGVLGRQGQGQGEDAALVGGAGGPLQRDGPDVDVGLRVGNGDALRGRGLALLQLLG